MHVGTAAVPARMRPFDDEHARLTLDRRLPLVLGDRLVLRHPGSRRVLGGAQVLDADPPPLRRRGESARRRSALADLRPTGDVLVEVARRGAVKEQQLRRLGLLDQAAAPPADVRVVDQWWVHAPVHDAWQARLRTAVDTIHERDPLAAGLSRGAAVDLLALPDPALLDAVVRAAGLEQVGGHIRLAGNRPRSGPGRSGGGRVGEPAAGTSVPRAGGRRSRGAAPRCPGAGRRRAGRPDASAAGRRRAAADGARAGDAGAGPAGAAIHHQPGPRGPGHHPPGRHPTAGNPRRPRLDPAAGRRPSDGRAPAGSADTLSGTPRKLGALAGVGAVLMIRPDCKPSRPPCAQPAVNGTLDSAV